MSLAWLRASFHHLHSSIKNIINEIAIAYKVDDELLMGRPTGMHGARLEAKVIFIVCLEQHLNDFIRAVEDADVDVIQVLASPFASSIVSLSKTQRVCRLRARKHWIRNGFFGRI